MNHEEYTRYKDWCDRIYDSDRDRLEKSFTNRVETDPRVGGRQEFFIKLFSQRIEECGGLGVDKFKNTLLSSGDDEEYMLGVLLHNALQTLYVEDFKDDVIIPSETENQMKRNELQVLRKKHNPDAKPAEEKELNLTVAQEDQLSALGSQSLAGGNQSLTTVDEEEKDE